MTRWNRIVLATGALAVALGSSGSFWSATSGVPALVAQDAGRPPVPSVGVGGFQPPGTSVDATVPMDPAEDDINAETERKLSQRLPGEYLQVPLHDVLEDIGNRYAVEILVNRTALEDAGVATDSAVSINLKRVRGDMLLELILDELDLVFTLRDGIVIVTTQDKLEEISEVRVYNCRDLLPPQPASDGAMGSMGMPGMPTAVPGMPGMPGMGRGGPGGEGMGMGMPGGMIGMMSGAGAMAVAGKGHGTEVTELMPLVALITETVEPDSWVDNGGAGSIKTYHGGLLVVNQNPQVQRKINRLLQEMRVKSRVSKPK